MVARQIDTVAELRQLINNAKSVDEMDDLRYATVKHMKTDSGILKEWQDKYWSLKICPTCGKVR